jgi:hypothetical protein
MIFGKSDTYDIFKPRHTKKILDCLAEGQWRLIKLCICQCNAGISRSAGVAAALSYIVSQDDSWVFENPRYLPNRIVCRTILDVCYRNEPHPPYYKLEGYGYLYLGSTIQSQEKFDLYLYRCADEDPLLMARYDDSRTGLILSALGGYHPALQEAQRRAEASGLLDPDHDLF